MAFKYSGTQIDAGGILERIRCVATTQFTKGDACKLANGLIEQITGQTDNVSHVFQWMDLPRNLMRPANGDNKTSSSDEYAHVIPVSKTLLKFDNKLTGNSAPPILAVACNAGGTTTTALVAYTGTTGANDFQGGTVYFKERNTHRQITASAYAGGVHTLTFEPPLDTTSGTGDTITVVPFAIGASPKFNSTTPQTGVSTAVADKTGGTVVVTDVDLSIPQIRVRFL